jgi:hypothetical protein
MSRLPAVVASAACLLAVGIVAAPGTLAGDVGPTGDLSGRWQTAALKMDGVGYTMTLLPTGRDGSYDARLRFSYQDGRRGSLIRARVTNAGSAARMTVTGDSGAAVTLKGSLGMDGSLYFPTCYRVLPFATKANADESCLFQEMPG